MAQHGSSHAAWQHTKELFQIILWKQGSMEQQTTKPFQRTQALEQMYFNTLAQGEQLREATY